jgi:biotin carboxyl carrier protein
MSVKVSAPMPRDISEVLVSVGDEVKFDRVVLEAMKMNNPICVPTNGRIKEVRVKKEDKVKKGQVLTVLERNNFSRSDIHQS